MEQWSTDKEGRFLQGQVKEDIKEGRSEHWANIALAICHVSWGFQFAAWKQPVNHCQPKIHLKRTYYYYYYYYRQSITDFCIEVCAYRPGLTLS